MRGQASLGYRSLGCRSLGVFAWGGLDATEYKEAQEACRYAPYEGVANSLKKRGLDPGPGD